jgi:ubiquinone/menaquinone biosynthesis C-methylase UbiE
MEPSTAEAVKIQRRYYEATASRYDSMHAHEGATDASMAKFVHGMMRVLAVQSVLDVGTATGLGMRELKAALPEAFVCGVEPVSGLITQALQNGSVHSGPLVRAVGEALPFPDASFDAVCEFAILHHVADPNAIVREMLRVARKAVFVCDSNRFGQGSFPARLGKLTLFKCGLWRTFNYLRTAGKGYKITEGDGLAYSYSVYDSLDLIRRWADRIVLIPSEGTKSASWFQPLLTSSGVVLCGIREQPDPGQATS